MLVDIDSSAMSNGSLIIDSPQDCNSKLEISSPARLRAERAGP